MGTITPSAAHKRIASGDLDPVYLVLGDDAVETAEMADAFQEVVDDGLRAFNVVRLYGGDATLGQVIDAANTLPMMAPRRIVIVLRAEHCLVPKRESRATAADLEEFEAYLTDPHPHASLILVAGDLDKRRSITKRLLKTATVVTCGVLDTLADAERWVRRRVSAEGMSIEPAAARLLAEQVGPNLTRLRGDVERLLIFATGQSSIGVADIREIAGPAAAHDDWGVARAIEHGQTAQALKELALVLESGAAAYMVLGQLAWVVRTKLPSARLPDAVEALFRTDLALKSSAGDHRVLLERLVLELCSAGLGGAGGRRPQGRRVVSKLS
ncbi:MAG: DNA polymerase III subunit delta [Vicinamibacterales bacterium]|jgi:DNA polymerase-3 subunit delta|nr:DNA polymerase III subunit delta [Vicinamibacterales bacterium]|tara:strand:- start:4897 stop:5877 length:981 start_codon:yes stop_codon:yes gene_type:complete